MALGLNCLGDTVDYYPPPQVKMVVGLSVLAVHKSCDRTEYDVIWDKKCT